MSFRSSIQAMAAAWQAMCEWRITPELAIGSPPDFTQSRKFRTFWAAEMSAGPGHRAQLAAERQRLDFDFPAVARFDPAFVALEPHRAGAQAVRYCGAGRRRDVEEVITSLTPLAYRAVTFATAHIRPARCRRPGWPIGRGQPCGRPSPAAWRRSRNRSGPAIRPRRRLGLYGRQGDGPSQRSQSTTSLGGSGSAGSQS